MFKFVVLLSITACVFGASIPTGLLPQLDGRIVGGTSTTIANFPYLVSLQRSGSHSCGGSIYSNKVCVTAAHCLQNVAASVLKIRAGSSTWSSGGSLVDVSSFTNNPNYNPNTMVYDVGVLKLATTLSLGSNIATIALASSAPAAGTAATVAGWGVQSSGSSSIPSTLLYVNVNIISPTQCASSTYSYGSQIKGTMICAAASGKDACQGDSGGPLAAKNQLVGIVSWGYGCAQAKYPGVYSDVAALRSWIVSNA